MARKNGVAHEATEDGHQLEDMVRMHQAIKWIKRNTNLSLLSLLITQISSFFFHCPQEKKQSRTCGVTCSHQTVFFFLLYSISPCGAQARKHKDSLQPNKFWRPHAQRTNDKSMNFRNVQNVHKQRHRETENRREEHEHTYSHGGGPQEIIC